MPNRTKLKYGMTLIEILIVIGIIAILAGIAMENYAKAQLRAKYSRVRAEFTTISAAIEAYQVDHNAPPRMAHYRFYQNSSLDLYEGLNVNGVLSSVLSTPVAYMTEIHFVDPYMVGVESAPLDQQLYTYQVLTVYRERLPESQFWRDASEYYGDWRLGSVGPDLLFGHGFSNSAQLLYDPTNGLISFGNIWSSARQKEENNLPPIPKLLGAH